VEKEDKTGKNRPAKPRPTASGHKPRQKSGLLSRFSDLTADDLSARIPTAGPAELELLISHPKATEAQAQLVLKNRHAGRGVLRLIGDDSRFSRNYDVKRGLVEHPTTPRHIAIRNLKFLYLRHLVDLLGNPMTIPGLRRHAENLLKNRLPGISLGERVSIARTGGRSVIKILADEREPMVLAALLTNPKSTEEDVVKLISNGSCPVETLEAIATKRRFRNRYQVRLAFATHGHVPLSLALGTLSGLLDRDLRLLARDESCRALLRHAAARVMEERRASPRSDPPCRKGRRATNTDRTADEAGPPDGEDGGSERQS